MKRLFRSRDGMVLGGVCSGLGKYSGADPVLIRVFWLISILIGGIGLIAYLIAWIIIPEEPTEMRGSHKETHAIEPQQLLGIFIIIIALLFLAGKLHIGFYIKDIFDWIWPAALIFAGILILAGPFNQRHTRKEEVEDVYGTGPSGVDEKTENESGENSDIDDSVKLEGDVSNSDSEEENEEKEKNESSYTRPDYDSINYPGDNGNKRFMRSRKDKMIFGVCGGIANYYETDPSVVRLTVSILTILTSGIPLIVYLILGIILPEDKNE